MDSVSFSALQRAENSSIMNSMNHRELLFWVSVLFSEPKIPQLLLSVAIADEIIKVSVLFSEPKIPQFRRW